MTDYRNRYATDTAPDLPTNAVLNVQLGHRSVRTFLPNPLAAGVLEAIVAAASSAPTSSNIQAWSVVAVTDPARKARQHRRRDEAHQLQPDLGSADIAITAEIEARIDAVHQLHGSPAP